MTADDAPFLLDAGDGWAWVWLDSFESRLAAAQALGAWFTSDGVERARQNGGGPALALVDPEGKTAAAIDFAFVDHPHLAVWRILDKGLGSQVMSAARPESSDGAPIQRMVDRAVMVFSLRLLVNGSPAGEVADGRHAFATPNSSGFVWSSGGVAHRDEGPALEVESRIRVWLTDGLKDRADGPAVETAEGGREYWRTGLRHRIGGPAVEFEGTPQLADFYEDGLRHRADGPAVINPHAGAEYWLRGLRQDNVFLKNWEKAATILYLAATGSPDALAWVDEAHGQRFTLTDIARRMALAECAGLPLSADDAIRDEYTKPSKDALDRSPLDRLQAKCARLGLALSLGRFDSVPDSERRSVARLLDIGSKRLARYRLGDPLTATETNGFGMGVPGPQAAAFLARRLAAEPAKDPEPMLATGGPVEFLHCWNPASRTGKPAKRRHASTSSAQLEPVPAADAPVVAWLPTDDGGRLALRRMDGEFYRPLLLPDSWEPADESGFRKAVGEGVAHRDNPFLDSTPMDKSVMALAEFCTPCEGDGGEAESESARRATARAGRLISVDGMVYRRTAPPTLRVVAEESSTGLGSGPALGNPRGRDRKIRVVWRLGLDLAQTDNQATIVSAFDRYPLWDAGLWTVRKTSEQRAVSGAHLGHDFPVGLAFPLASLESAVEAMRQIATAAGVPAADDAPRVETVVPLDEDEPLETLEALKRYGRQAFHVVGKKIERAAWAEEALAAIEAGDAAAMEDAAAKLEGSAKGSGGSDPWERYLGTLAGIAARHLRRRCGGEHDDAEALSRLGM